MEDDREKKAQSAFELENSPTDAAFTCPQPCPQSPIGSLDRDPDYQEAKSRYRTADEKLRPLINEIMCGKGYVDDEDTTFYAASEQW